LESTLEGRPVFDLTGYFKLYVAKESIRIVYRIVELDVIVEVAAIGKREDLAVFREAIRRILKA
jgi:hypothetical protein